MNVGAGLEGANIPTKKMFKIILKENPGAIIFFTTASTFDGWRTFDGDELMQEFPDGIELDVVGPDPFKNRRWYATVTVTPDGKVKVR